MKSAKEILSELYKIEQVGAKPAPASDATKGQGTEVRISKQRSRKLNLIELVRTKRDAGRQEIGYSSRPFILCGLPVRRPAGGGLEHIRRNGKFFLRVTGDPRFGLPFGQDRLIPIWVSTLAIRQKNRVIQFSSGAEILRTFGLPPGGKEYARLMQGFKRIFSATIFFGTEEQLQADAVWDWARFHFFDRLRVWYTRDVNQATLPGDDFENVVVLSESFWNEIQAHPIPLDLDVVKSLKDSPGCLDFYLWLAWRCWTSKRNERIPLFDATGLINQLGTPQYTRERRFRQRVTQWLNTVHTFWPKCPAALSEDGRFLILAPAKCLALSTTKQ